MLPLLDFESSASAIPPLRLQLGSSQHLHTISHFLFFGEFLRLFICAWYDVRMTQFYNDAIFWIETEKIKPNPYQPRREFNEDALRDLSDSIRMYGVLQPLVVTRTEVITADGGLNVEYELISGERRLRASRLAGLSAVPAIIRSNTDDARVKLELAIIENLQREDLNPVDRARSFKRLADEFSLKHGQIAAKVGKSREYVSNSMRLLMLSEEILNAISDGKITEGHARPLMMLIDRPEEQTTLFKEITLKKLTVREAEAIARRVAYDKIRKKEFVVDPEIIELENKLTETLGTRVQIERKEAGGKIMIDFFSNADLRSILEKVQQHQVENSEVADVQAEASSGLQSDIAADVLTDTAPIDDRSAADVVADAKSDDAELYDLKNFSI